MIRDYVLAWLMSVALEALEAACSPWVPSWRECWWLRWLVDVALCNALGIYLGMLACRRLELRVFDWVGWRRRKAVIAAAPRRHGRGRQRRRPRARGGGTGGGQSTGSTGSSGMDSSSDDSESACSGGGGGVRQRRGGRQQPLLRAFAKAWVRYDWGVFTSTERFLAVLAVCGAMCAIFVNTPLLAVGLGVEGERCRWEGWFGTGGWSHPGMLRAALWFTAGPLAINEAYLYVSNAALGKIGSRAWLATITVATESLVSLKHARRSIAHTATAAEEEAAQAAAGAAAAEVELAAAAASASGDSTRVLLQGVGGVLVALCAIILCRCSAPRRAPSARAAGVGLGVPARAQHQHDHQHGD